jgi:hypothetical protein
VTAKAKVRDAKQAALAARDGVLVDYEAAFRRLFSNSRQPLVPAPDELSLDNLPLPIDEFVTKMFGKESGYGKPSPLLSQHPRVARYVARKGLYIAVAMAAWERLQLDRRATKLPELDARLKKINAVIKGTDAIGKLWLHGMLPPEATAPSPETGRYPAGGLV